MTDDRKNNLGKMMTISKSKSSNYNAAKLRFVSNTKVLNDKRALEGQRALNENFI